MFDLEQYQFDNPVGIYPGTEPLRNNLSDLEQAAKEALDKCTAFARLGERELVYYWFEKHIELIKKIEGVIEE